jgi:hypothetical protein
MEDTSTKRQRVDPGTLRRSTRWRFVLLMVRIFARRANFGPVQFSVFSRETVAAAIFGVRGLVTAFFFRRYVTEWQRFIQRPR